MHWLYVLCLFGLALGQQQTPDAVEDNWVPREQIPIVPESAAARYLGLSSGATQTVPDIRTTFSCIGRRYGYFADVDNNCQIFHVCHPSTNAKGDPVIFHFSQFCSKGTRFDQRQLTCLPETSPSIIPCADSTRYYPLVESRFAEVPVVQRGVIGAIPQVIQQNPIPAGQIRSNVLPKKGLRETAQTISNVAIPTKNIARSQTLTQPIVEQQGINPIQYQQRSFVQQSVPVVTRFVQSNPGQNIPYQSIPVQNIPYQSIPVQNIRYQSIPVQTVPVQTIPVHLYSSIPTGNVLRNERPLVSPAAKQRAANTIQQQVLAQPQVAPTAALTVPQPAPSPVDQSFDSQIPQVAPAAPLTAPEPLPLPVGQPGPVADTRAEEPGQSVVQPQNVSVEQPAQEQVQPDQKPVAQPLIQSVEQPVVEARDEGIVERPASRLSLLKETLQ